MITSCSLAICILPTISMITAIVVFVVVVFAIGGHHLCQLYAQEGGCDGGASRHRGSPEPALSLLLSVREQEARPAEEAWPEQENHGHL